jgi:hypothetical protein
MAEANPFDIEDIIHVTMPEQVHLIRWDIPDWLALEKETNLALMRVLMAAMSASK